MNETGERPPAKADRDEPTKPQLDGVRAPVPSSGRDVTTGRVATHDLDVPVVGIGASAGGLGALQAFFSAIPPNTTTGLAFVLVQHLAPDQKSLLAELIGHHTDMEVLEAQDGAKVESEHVYVIPPGRFLELKDGALRLSTPIAARGLRLPIDFFFRSLAQQRDERAIAVVLSGTGSDGTVGAKEVKGRGGLVVVQQPETAEYDGMPRNAIATGLVDFVLPPQEMPETLIAYMRRALTGEPAVETTPDTTNNTELKEILSRLHTETGHDFSLYKRDTVMRRVRRRMALSQLEDTRDYLRFVGDNPNELDGLFRDLLIGVTSFFRDADAFAAVRDVVIPRIFAGKQPRDTVRIWVCACSTGEEAYSIAILMHEYLEAHKVRLNVQIFATDINDVAIAQARRALFPAGIATSVSPEHLDRYFTQETTDGPYQLDKRIRDLVIFSNHDVHRDPAFSRLDLISCRNLLIYMTAELQNKIVPLFHWALNPSGMLLLGNSETVGECATLFSVLDRKQKIYLRASDRPAALPGAAPGWRRYQRPYQTPAPRPRSDAAGRTPAVTAKTQMEQALLLHYAQAAVLIDARGEILHIYGRTGRYLEPAPGNAALNIFSMARQGLRRDLMTAVHRTVAGGERVVRRGIHVLTNGGTSLVDLTVKAVAGADGEPSRPSLCLVLFEEAAAGPVVGSGPSEGKAGGTSESAEQSVAQLEQALLDKEEYLQTTLEEMETTNEELRATNEEMQSVNEEMQSSNEEMETSKEELQSVNEELTTVNAELQNKLMELSRVNNDMRNLLAGTGIATLFVDQDLCIARFTPATTDVINLIVTDVGRPVSHVVSNLMGYTQLAEDVGTVLETLVPQETEVQTRAGTWYLMGIRPYRTLENVIDGAVVTFVDITELRRSQRAVANALAYAQGIVDTIRQPLLVLNEALRVVSANPAFYKTFGVSPGETEGRLLYELGDGQWSIPRLRELLEEILPEESTLEGYQVQHAFSGLGERTWVLNARRISREGGEDALILLAIEDGTHGSEAGAEPLSKLTPTGPPAPEAGQNDR